jgi:hypothetical protein
MIILVAQLISKAGYKDVFLWRWPPVPNAWLQLSLIRSAVEKVHEVILPWAPPVLHQGVRLRSLPVMLPRWVLMKVCHDRPDF